MNARAAVRGAIIEILPSVTPDDIDESLHLRDLGADSVDRVEILLQALQRSGVSAQLAEFNDIPNIGSLIAYLDARHKETAR
ncbi:phosphopantetheine-binding protein [Mycobacterium stomatepiae]|uniref:Carrier domain-containing protein n=1 Tax=Mycobacterium stomatepiae TaxID=470076 RepID=A0A7I7Q871_9MYCO|nr:phosphopantetheine-binding protein [Mycobacterium stomatepiae]MCV7163078.1 acyl carrier protein [Mycobacterium stomatepiae]BBY22236.1 hypothetical protein MSTO_24410 [Mycobacterium stomatepiae]